MYTSLALALAIQEITLGPLHKLAQSSTETLSVSKVPGYNTTTGGGTVGTRPRTQPPRAGHPVHVCGVPVIPQETPAVEPRLCRGAAGFGVAVEFLTGTPRLRIKQCRSYLVLINIATGQWALPFVAQQSIVPPWSWPHAPAIKRWRFTSPHHNTPAAASLTMIRQVSVILLAIGFQVISSQGPPPFPPNIPPQCRGPPQVTEKPHECCKIPPFFEDADFEECGFKKADDEHPHERHGPPDCSKQLCMLKKYDLAKEDNIDFEALAKFMDKWVEAHPDFKSSVDAAKERCIGKPLPGPPYICEANKIVFCVSSTLIEFCPKWEATDGCQKLKSHIEECAPLFNRKQ
ncbi:hypothetical protein evm_006756 [Chilo suppressalis]|nr:hypothetical protein evm_006756 [Chilo suppressalis]